MNTSSRTRIVTLSDGWTMRQAPGTIRWGLYTETGVFSHMLSVNMDAIVTSAFTAGMEFQEAESSVKAAEPKLPCQNHPETCNCDYHCP